MRQSGFTLIELMIAMVVGLTAVSSVYALGSAMSEQFFVEQRVASSQGTSRVATLELRQDISRAGLFGTPNASLVGGPGVNRFEPTCDPIAPELPRLGGGNGPMGAFQYYTNEDIAVLDPDSVNVGARADRLRVLTSMYLTEQLLVSSTSINGEVIVLQTGNQAYRRTFAWGGTAGPFTSGSPPDYLSGDLNWDTAWGSEAGSWKGIGQRGARAFQSGSVLHVETPEGRHFFRSVFGKGANVENQIRLVLAAGDGLPIGTACLPGAAEGSTIAPLQWVEYAIIDPFAPADTSNPDDFLKFDGIFFGDLADADSPIHDVHALTEADLLESPNRVLVRRILDANDGSVKANSTQVVAEFVTHFEVSFIVDANSGSTTSGSPPLLSLETGATAEATVNGNPEQVRSVIIDLGIRSPLEDPSLQYDGSPTRFEVDKDAQGSARVRHLRIEVPVMSVARRNLG
ncbi:MAG: prepilin-type N-terminal cleavage/methylation domain-containing protein [Myxococcales bacterium]|nr:prepilin-type N-terminal cleavage/methylation domain-containing protein [Myxococcales bacterium]